MIEYLQHHGLGHSSLSTRLKIFAKVCELVHSKGQEEISQAAFDWQVDRALWELHCKLLAALSINSTRGVRDRR